MSEHGTGLVYCLGLFLEHAHLWRKSREVDDGTRVLIWFSGASDHILEMVIPDFLPEDLRNRLHAFKEDVIEKGHGALGWSGKLTEDDIVQAIREAEELLLLIDKYFGIPAENAEAGASSDYRADKTVVKD